MEYRKVGTRLIVRLDRGDEVIECLTDLCRREQVTAATVTGVGSVEGVELGYYDLTTRNYITRPFPEVQELLSMTGNVALLEGDPSRPFVHAHVVLGGPEMVTRGGHLVRATVAVTLEAVLTVLDTKVSRRQNDDVGLKLWAFDG